jgi:hypothetical protein
MRMRRRAIVLLPLALVAVLASAVPTAAFNPDTEVTVGSPDAPFSQNKQNEPWVAIDPNNPAILAGGANDNIDMEACNAGSTTTCPFTAGVGVSGITFSLDSGTNWIQPTYTGYSARGCLGPVECAPNPAGPIGTIPWYFENGLSSGGDPALVFGPRPDGDGDFSWDNGSRLYYANLTANFPGKATFKGFEALAVSRTDDVIAAAANDKTAWLPPVIASKQSSATFSDKELITADQVSSSPFFGNVYICNTDFRSVGGAPEPIRVVTSRDGGDTWSTVQISNAANTGIDAGRAGGRQGCAIKTDSEGVVYVAWRGGFKRNEVVWLSRSFNGGRQFDTPRVVGITGTVGALDPAQRRFTFDGVAGSRTNSSVSIDIANGAPTGAGATDRIVVGFVDATAGLNNEKAAVRFSDNGGASWSPVVNGAEAGDRPDFPWVAISPDGGDVYLTYMGFLDPWRSTTADPRRMQGVVRHAAGNLTGWSTLHRGAIGDARGSSANGLTSEFLGDYNSVAATNAFAVAVWNDVRNAAVCAPMNTYRQSVVDGSPGAVPAPQADCPPTFGNTDIFGGSYADPTP